MPATAPAQVLVVDDEPDLRTLYEMALVREGHQVDAAGSLAQAREQAQALPQQARLQRLQTSDRDTPSWQGSLVVRLP